MLKRATSSFQNALSTPHLAKILLQAPARSFASQEPDNKHMLNEQMVKDELKAFEDNLTDAQRERLHHERQLLQTQQRLSAADPNNWTNKFASMTLDDMKTIPYGYMKKYGAMINFIIRMDKEARVAENKEYMGYYDRIKNQKALQTNEEKEAYQKWRDLM